MNENSVFRFIGKFFVCEIDWRLTYVYNAYKGQSDGIDYVAVNDGFSNSIWDLESFLSNHTEVLSTDPPQRATPEDPLHPVCKARRYANDIQAKTN